MKLKCVTLLLYSFWPCHSNWRMLFSAFEVPSVQFSHSVMSDSLQPHGLQHARPPCPLPTPGIYSNSCPSSRWCHPTISSSVVLFSSCPQSVPASGSFPMSQFFPSGGQRIGAFSISISPSNEYSGLISFRVDWLDLLAVQGILKSLLQHHSSKLWNSLAFSMIQQMLAVWSLVPLSFLKPAWISGSSWFTYWWSLAWRILSITLLACEMSAIVQ